jgi:hypothetical protein
MRRTACQNPRRSHVPATRPGDQAKNRPAGQAHAGLLGVYLAGGQPYHGTMLTWAADPWSAEDRPLRDEHCSAHGINIIDEFINFIKSPIDNIDKSCYPAVDKSSKTRTARGENPWN